MSSIDPAMKADGEPAAGLARPALSRWLLPNLALPALIIVLALVTGLVEPRFFSASNLENLARQMVPLMIASVGQAVAIISGGLDLSIAAVMSLAGVVGILLMNDMGIAAGILAMILTGTLVGSVAGWVIAYLKTPPLIVTLGMMSIAQAVALILSNGIPIYRVPSPFVDAVGFGSVAGIPSMVLIGLGTLALGWIILRRTIFGRYVYAMGSSHSATTKSGIDVRWYTMLVYALAGTTSGIGAIVMTAWTSAAQPLSAPNLTLESVAAVVLGGVALAGGSGGILNVIYGVIILGMLSNAMNMMGISAYYQMLAVGVVIILAVALDRFRRATGY